MIKKNKDQRSQSKGILREGSVRSLLDPSHNLLKTTLKNKKTSLANTPRKLISQMKSSKNPKTTKASLKAYQSTSPFLNNHPPPQTELFEATSSLTLKLLTGKTNQSEKSSRKVTPNLLNSNPEMLNPLRISKILPKNVNLCINIQKEAIFRPYAHEKEEDFKYIEFSIRRRNEYWKKKKFQQYMISKNKDPFKICKEPHSLNRLRTGLGKKVSLHLSKTKTNDTLSSSKEFRIWSLKNTPVDKNRSSLRLCESVMSFYPSSNRSPACHTPQIDSCTNSP